MLPILDQCAVTDTRYDLFVQALMTAEFSGDIQKDYATRVASAVDNSIYQVVPEVVLFPKSSSDIEKIFTLLNQKQFCHLKISPRGAGTGTNGQSLSPGMIIDSSRYLTRIIEINVAEHYVRVEPGVVLDQLNEALAEHQLFFAPNLSPSDRATLGGMASTDACGKGSRIYGRTSDHILALGCVLSNGQSIEITEISAQNAKNLQKNNPASLWTNIYKVVQEEIIEQYDEITNQFPKLDRCMTGYNLAKTYDQKRQIINLNYLISGSEGTLVYITELTLKLTPVPQHKLLFAVFYSDFISALNDGKSLLLFEPAAIETIDQHILALAEKDPIYPQISHMFPKENAHRIKALNLVEFIADDAAKLLAIQNNVITQLTKHNRGFYLAQNAQEIQMLWMLRKKGVGLLGAMPGAKKPVAFMEDTAVPPRYLKDYIVEIKALLDRHGLIYGLFGHIDVGCLHIRPALDLHCEQDRQIIIKLTKAVSDLVKKYDGVYFSEHGKGFRSEYTKDYFGEKLYVSLQKIKGAFDPLNQMNPGKIVVPYQSDDKIVQVDGPFRGYQDKIIPTKTRAVFSGAFDCNGNSACLNFNADHTMCPSAQISHNWVYSPKGRSALLREWLKQLSLKGYYPDTSQGRARKLLKSSINSTDFSAQVYDSLDKCLGCKACATACPIKVDIPAMKSLFLAHFHRRYRRPLKDYLIKYIEIIGRYQAKWPSFFNRLQNTAIMRNVIEKSLKLVDTPALSCDTLQKGLLRRKAPIFSFKKLQDHRQHDKVVCIVQDAFSSFYDANVVLSIYDFLTKLGYIVYILPFMENGKAAQVKGFLSYFAKKAKKAVDFYNQVAAFSFPLVGIDPSMTLVYRDEYQKQFKNVIQFKVLLFQEWFVTELDKLTSVFNAYAKIVKTPKQPEGPYLFGHCSERALVDASMTDWQKIFNAFNLSLTIVKVGCCGMAGTFGHERQHRNMSHDIFESSWHRKIQQCGDSAKENLLMTGFSCRCQVKRFSKQSCLHPIQYLVNSTVLW